MLIYVVFHVRDFQEFIYYLFILDFELGIFLIRGCRGLWGYY